MVAVSQAPLFVALAFLLSSFLPFVTCFGPSQSPIMPPTMPDNAANQEITLSDVSVISLSAEDAEMSSCYAIRNAVFIQEQQVPIEIEMDSYDKSAIHILAISGDVPCGAARLVITEEKNGNKVGKIGRVCVLKDKRGCGIGRKIMEFAVEELHRLIGSGNKARLGAQVHALKFYESLGFELIPGEEEYMAAGGVPHRDMELIL